MSKMKTSFLAQVKTVIANLDRDSNVIDRSLVLVVLNPKPTTNSVFGVPSYPVYQPPSFAMTGEGGQPPLQITLPTADSNSIKAGDWLSVRVTQLSEEEQDQLAKMLVERSESTAKMEQLRGQDGEEAKALAIRMIEVQEKIVKRLGPQFGDDE